MSAMSSVSPVSPVSPTSPRGNAASAPGCGWNHICALHDILPDSGVAALIDGRQVAIFRVRDAVYAIGNHDPASGANVLARGIVGDVGGEIVVASPIYKHHFSLISGRCLEEPELSVPTYLARIHEQQLWVRGEAALQRRWSGRRRLVVVGGGAAAMHTLQELLALAPNVYDITVFGAEVRAGVERARLSPPSAGEKPIEEDMAHPADWCAQHGIALYAADPVVHIDRARRLVRSRSGLETAYDRLLLATGSLPVELPVEGRDLPGVVTFRELQTVEAMTAAARTHGRAVVVGGGMLGLEAASGLASRGMDVTVVQLAAQLMERRLDAAAASLLRQELERRGLKFVMPARTQCIRGSERVTALVLADGRELPADLIVIAVGMHPNTALAEAAGLRCERGVLVDDTLLTYDPAIYAVGGCVQHCGSGSSGSSSGGSGGTGSGGWVAPLPEQARICAAHLAERGIRMYRGARISPPFRLSGVEVFSAGDPVGPPGSESLVLRDPRRGVYKRLVIHGDRVRGAVLYGDVRDGHWYAELISEGRDIRLLRERLLFGAGVAAGPDQHVAAQGERALMQ